LGRENISIFSNGANYLFELCELWGLYVKIIFGFSAEYDLTFWWKELEWEDTAGDEILSIYFWWESEIPLFLLKFIFIIKCK